MDETFEDYRSGVLVSRGTHQAKFALADVAISLETADHVTEKGEKALEVLFQCVGALACKPSGTDSRRLAPGRTSTFRMRANDRESSGPFRC